MLGSFRDRSQPSKKVPKNPPFSILFYFIIFNFHKVINFLELKKQLQQKHEEGWLGVSFKPENFIPGLIIGFICGLFLDLSKPGKGYDARKISRPLPGQNQQLPRIVSSNTDEELKMVCLLLCLA